MLSNKVYDIWNKIQRWLPAVGTLYLGLSKIWNFPYGNEVNQTIILIATFLAVTLEISSNGYYKMEAKKEINDFDTNNVSENG